MAKVTVGESLSKLRFYLTSTNVDGTESPVDLTGCTCVTKYRINGGTQKTINLSTVAPATAGILEGQVEAVSFDVSGVAAGRIYITSGPRTGMSYKWQLEVEAVE